ncbi:AAA family ATPase [Nocardiopsis tropica]|uniref:AAA family ATPase n=1 Tax=Nocardiopsis tropica TaxID=109330 RepID=A0ABU7KLG1_9ACTN|nr:AAA family ATPase [Nocardiopsis umidischolae]MEE2050134.1 AAA family ATPase [Nocardiopsis umidischolae]
MNPPPPDTHTDEAGVLPATAEPIGRQEETAALDALLSGARGGSGGALALWGEPGIGKSTLLRYAHDRAADFVRLSHRATRSESDLPFAGLHGLLRPVAARMESLTTDRGAALRTALEAGAASANPLPVGAAVLSLLCAIAEERPVLVSLDDAQWLDGASARCLGILARRVAAHPVVVLVADHGDPAARPWEGIPDVRVEGLSEESARHLHATVAPHADEAMVRAAVEEAGGNPLALLEAVGAGWGPDEVEPLPGRLRPPVGPRLSRAFRAAIEALSPPARLLTVLVAAEDHGDLLVVRRAGRASGIDDTAWDEAVDAGLLRVRGERVGFRHPVVRRAVYECCGEAARRRAHRALAAALPDEAEEHAWHLASAAHDHDEDVAGLLERTAARSRVRGAMAAEARALRRAAELSPAPVDASRRLAGAARAAWDAGWATTAERLLDDAERLAPGTHIARCSLGLRGVIEASRGAPELAHHYLTTDMDLVEDPGTALELGTTAMRAGWAAGRSDLAAGALESLLELDVEEQAGLPVLLAWWSDDPAADSAPVDPTGFADALARARRTPLRLLPPAPLAVVWGIDTAMGEVLRRRAPHLRRRFEPARLADVLAHTATLDGFAGRWAESESAAAEGLRLAEDVGADQISAHCRNCLGWLAAVRGDEHRAAEAADRVLRTALPRGSRAVSAASYWINGMTSLFQERPEEALDTLLRLADPGHGAMHPTFALLAALDTAEAAVHVGRLDVAEERVRRLHAWARRTGAPWACSSAHAAEALLGGPRAEDAFRAALDVPGTRSQPLLRARVQLFYGEWLRRGRRRTDARVHLGSALEVFDRLGAEPLGRRARRERDLTGPPGGRGSPDAGEDVRLTAQEHRIARLAAQQMTNREIAAKLRISHRTVGHHLGNVFAKLGITARSELGRTHGGPEPG